MNNNNSINILQCKAEDWLLVSTLLQTLQQLSMVPSIYMILWFKLTFSEVRDELPEYWNDG